jgi:hypothetical protein
MSKYRLNLRYQCGDEILYEEHTFFKDRDEEAIEEARKICTENRIREEKEPFIRSLLGIDSAHTDFHLPAEVKISSLYKSVTVKDLAKNDDTKETFFQIGPPLW